MLNPVVKEKTKVDDYRPLANNSFPTHRPPRRRNFSAGWGDR